MRSREVSPAIGGPDPTPRGRRSVLAERALDRVGGVADLVLDRAGGPVDPALVLEGVVAGQAPGGVRDASLVLVGGSVPGRGLLEEWSVSGSAPLAARRR